MNKIITISMAIILTACGGGGGGGTDVAGAIISGSVSGGGNSGNNTSTPTVTLSASSYEVVSGDRTTLQWSSSNASSCTASGSWSGSKSLNGSENITLNSYGDYSFSIDCSGATSTIQINVVDQDREGNCTNPHTAKIEKDYLGNFPIEMSQNSFGPDHIKTVGLKDYGVQWIYDSYKSSNPSLVADCTR